MCADLIIKTCPCGAPYTRESFDALPCTPNWELPWGEVWEQRTCPCGSSICVLVREGSPEEEEAYRASRARPRHTPSSPPPALV